MGETGCPPGATPVHIVGDETRPSVPNQTVQQWAIRNGIFRRTSPLLPGNMVETFNPTLELTEVLRPAVRTTEIDNATGISTATTVQIAGAKDLVKVIRAIGYEITTEVPDEVLISITGQSGPGPVELSMDKGFPSDGRIIGNEDSPLTQTFFALLPLALLPGDVIIFKGDQSPAKQWESKVTIWIETYPLPLRPAGL